MINSIYSINDLYCELYEDVFGIDPYIVSQRLSPGTGYMGESWYTILSNYSFSGTKDLYIYLNPAGNLDNGCYGGGKLDY